MTDDAEVSWMLVEQLVKLGRQLSAEERKRVAARESKLVLLAAGQQVIDVSPALSAVLKLVEQMPAEERQLIEQRQAKVVVLSARQQVIEKTPAVTAALKVVDQLSSAELLDIEERRAKIAFLPKGAKIDYAFDPQEVASRIEQLGNVDDIVRVLESDSRLTLTNLKKVAGALGIALPSSAKAKTAPRHIAEALSGGRTARDPQLPGYDDEGQRLADGVRQRGRRVAPWDPFPVYVAGGESVLRNRLLALDLEQLRDMVADHGMDSARLTTKWQDRERLVELIVSRVRDRASKGHAFRPPARSDA